MTIHTVENPSIAPESSTQSDSPRLFYSVGVMAYNEEMNIRRTLHAVLEQESLRTRVAEVIVVASGCTDKTVTIVREIMQSDTRVQLIVQEQREGKASAINLFLRRASSPVLALVGADIIPEKDALERLCARFEDETVGMVGARPVPVNDQDTFTGHAAHLLWRLHDTLARRSPKLGEVVAFRNVVSSIPTDTAVDELSLQAIIARRGLRMVYVPEAVVYNKGPMTIRDFLKQRRRIYAGHLRIRSQEKYEAPTMNAGAVLRALADNAPDFAGSPRQVAWTIGTVALEVLARAQGGYDVKRHRSHHVWQAVTSTKTVEDEQRKLRRICNTQSVIVLRISHARPTQSHYLPARERQVTRRMLSALIPTLRQSIRKNDLLSIHGSDTLVVLLNAERKEAELIGLRLQHVIEMQQISQKTGAIAHPEVQYHAVSFAE
ncbi:MAG TPA: glycosyltransferase [Ktedonobacteraceae bacterium]|nr:glycosyltransferase [Ktedonobacteraceae bacterium]